MNISDGMTLELSYFGTEIPFSNFSQRKHTGMSIYSTLGQIIFDSTVEIQIVLYSQCTVGVTMWIAKAYVYL